MTVLHGILGAFGITVVVMLIWLAYLLLSVRTWHPGDGPRGK